LVIVFFGFLKSRKDMDTLIRAFDQVHAVEPLTRLLLVGGVASRSFCGEQAELHWERLRKLVAELGLGEYIHATGYLSAEEVSCNLLGADVGVLPFQRGVTLKSGSLMALLAHGLPVVATRHSPPDADLAEGKVIRLTEPCDVDALAAVLLEIVKSTQLRNELRTASQNFFRNRTWPIIAQQHLRVYWTVLENRPAI
jgi:glycosyltransferase involved in cell wall biosynthesis